MNGSAHHLRRASADDVPGLLALWQTSGLPAGDLEKRFTEFQLIEDAEGRILGAAGLRVQEQQGHFHSEAYADFGQADTLRPLLWRRMKNVAGSHGLYRLWTTETAPYWRQEDFVSADGEILAKLPASFGPREGRWLTFKLRDEVVLDQFLAGELLAFKKEEQERNAELLRQAGTFKALATLIALLAFVLVALAIFHMFRRQMFSPH
jgi:N-acetylglutamate synthase-like GNAT family acetyltransferase